MTEEGRRRQGPAVAEPALQVAFTPDEVAASMRVTRRTVYTWLRSGKLQAHNTGGRWNITQAGINAFYAANAPVPEQAASGSERGSEAGSETEQQKRDKSAKKRSRRK